MSYLVDVLALKLREKGLEALVISLNADGAEDLLDVGLRRGGVAGEAEEEVSCHVLHLDGVYCNISMALICSIAFACCRAK